MPSVAGIEMALHCLETIEFNYTATYFQVPEKRNSLKKSCKPIISDKYAIVGH
jgi:hypothetical protein